MLFYLDNVATSHRMPMLSFLFFIILASYVDDKLCRCYLYFHL